MEVLDTGHDYLLHSFDGGESVRLTFVKRNDPPEKYPGNDSAYPGTQIQEVLQQDVELSKRHVPEQAEGLRVRRFRKMPRKPQVHLRNQVRMQVGDL